MAARSHAQLKRLLDELYHRYSRPVFLSTSALSIPHQYGSPEDREIAAFVAASLAYGNVKQIHRSANAALEAMGKSPARFIRRFDPTRDAARFQQFVHRFNSGLDLALLCHLLHQAIAAEGSLQAFFLKGYDPIHEDIEPALTSFACRMLLLDVAPFYRSGTLPAKAGVRFFFPSPAQGSACKRLNLFLRWMVRRNDAIDFGIWAEVSSAKLIVPLDTHVARIARQLGLTRIKQPNWRMAKEVTRRLRAFDPDDPVKYDFALCRLGVLKQPIPSPE
ncbi:TIGR02757 family protein [Candidatus Methylomirabilis sp.]|uniref:TIGR02757 family protein n=1 Tax=Candidatus Methylomirabilis sp. TaxID=2032687 RepID=UPI002A6412B1|nr:TIGR02757 family protein [Candidatus Methylomirabilis sp.]